MEAIAQDIWVQHRPLRFFGVETGTRTTIVRLEDGGLFVHSPGPLTDATRSFVAEHGDVRAVVSPSLFHHMSAGDWKAAFPSAVLCCCPGLQKKRSDVAWDRVLSDACEPEWKADLDQVYFGARTMENEVVFFHKKSRTMICCDTLFNLRSHSSRLTRLVSVLMGNNKPGATWLEHIMIRDRKAARAQIGAMLEWDIERIILGHGDVVPSGGKEVLRRAYAWL